MIEKRSNIDDDEVNYLKSLTIQSVDRNQTTRISSTNVNYTDTLVSVLSIQMSKVKGLGIFTSNFIEGGTEVCLYGGSQLQTEKEHLFELKQLNDKILFFDKKWWNGRTSH